MERLWPTLQAVDSSSGALGTATNKTVHELIEILLARAGGRRALVDGVRLKHQLPYVSPGR